MRLAILLATACWLLAGASAAAAGPVASLTLTPRFGTSLIGTTLCVTATARDSGGAPVAGATVEFQRTGYVEATTDANGSAEFCFTSLTPGHETFSALVYSATGSLLAYAYGDREWAAPGPRYVTAGPNDLTPTIRTQACLTARVTDAVGTIVAGVAVELVSLFGSPNIVPAMVATTNTSGVATFCYSGAKAGYDTLIVTADADGDGFFEGGSEPQSYPTIRWIQPQTLTLSFVATPTIRTQVCIEVTATSQELAVPGARIGVRSWPITVNAGPDQSANRGQRAFLTTDASGKATFCYTDTSARPGYDDILFFADNNTDGEFPNTGSQDPGFEAGASAFVRWIAPQTFSLQYPTTPTIHTQACITASARTYDGLIVPGATLGVRSFPRSTNGGPDQSANRGLSGTMTTDASGGATFCYTDTSVRGGIDELFVFADNNADGWWESYDVLDPRSEPGDTAAIRWISPETFTVTAPERALALTRVCVDVVARTHDGLPVPGARLGFMSLPTSWIGPDIYNANPGQRAFVVTDAAGFARYCFTDSSGRAGADQLGVWADNNADGVWPIVAYDDPRQEPGHGVWISWYETTPPVISVPASIVAEATAPAGAVVTYAVTAEDAADGPVPALCAPASGATFALGTTTVRCEARDRSGNFAERSFAVTVRDTTGPAVTVPGPLTLDASTPAGAVVIFQASASDLVDGPRAASCAPASGATFAPGRTTVTCTASDLRGNIGSASFVVTIRGAADQLSALELAADGYGPGKSLPAKARNARADVTAGRTSAACGLLAAFISEVTAQTGKTVPPSKAVELNAAATRIRTLLGC